MKTKMLTNNLVEARVSVALQNGKLSITPQKIKIGPEIRRQWVYK